MYVYIDANGIAWTEIDAFAISEGLDPKAFTEELNTAHWRGLLEPDSISIEVVRDGLCDVRLSALIILKIL